MTTSAREDRKTGPRTATPEPGTEHHSPAQAAKAPGPWSSPLSS